jgi:hypothetical protein
MQQIKNIYNWANFTLYVVCFLTIKALSYYGVPIAQSFAPVIIMGCISIYFIEKCKKVSEIKKDLNRLYVSECQKKRYMSIILKRNNIRKCKQKK